MWVKHNHFINIEITNIAVVIKMKKINKVIRNGLSGIIYFLILTLFTIEGFSANIAIVFPSKQFHIQKGELTFVWDNQIVDIGDTLQAQKYEVTFWMRNRPFTRTMEIIPEQNNPQCVLTFKKIREHFRRHGRYFWKVTAYDSLNRVYISDIRSFFVDIIKPRRIKDAWEHPYSLHFQWNHRQQTEELSSFIQNISPNKHFKDYSELGFVLNQIQNRKPYLHFSEKCYLISQIGLGLDVHGEFRLMQNKFFALKPYVSSRYNFFSAGIKNFSNSLFHWQLGAKWELMPKGYLSLQTAYIPDYQIRYAENGKRLRTWTGEGYEIGVRCVIPEHFIETFSVLGIHVNLRKFPVYLSYTKIHDSYSGVDLNMRRVTVSYQF